MVKLFLFQTPGPGVQGSPKRYGPALIKKIWKYDTKYTLIVVDNFWFRWQLIDITIISVIAVLVIGITGARFCELYKKLILGSLDNQSWLQNLTHTVWAVLNESFVWGFLTGLEDRTPVWQCPQQNQKYFSFHSVKCSQRLQHHQDLFQRFTDRNHEVTLSRLNILFVNPGPVARIFWPVHLTSGGICLSSFVKWLIFLNF